MSLLNVPEYLVSRRVWGEIWWCAQDTYDGKLETYWVWRRENAHTFSREQAEAIVAEFAPCDKKIEYKIILLEA